jgi:MoaA/NifB/PqqE/SkfB family radical SAM enzyme
MASSKHLVLGLENRRLYLFGDEDFQNTVVISGAFCLEQGCIEVLELMTSLVFLISVDDLAGRLVPDHRVYEELQSLQITGLRPTVSIGAGAEPLPVAGNLNDPLWLSVCLSGRCDSKCVFCYTENIRNDRPLEFRVVAEALECGRRAKAEIVVFSGGEPTLCKDLDKFVRLARQIGYREIGIQTNGHRLARKDYLDSLIDAGLSNSMVSLHGPTASAHDRIARTPKSFERAVEAISNLAESGIHATVNFVTCRENGPFAAQVVDAVAERNGRAILRFSFLIVEGAAYDKLKDDLTTLPEFVAWVTPALSRAREIGLSVEVENVPPCISSELGVSDGYALSRRRSLMQVSSFYTADRDRGELDVKLEACEGCVKSTNCSGLQMAYLANIRNGADHIRPVGSAGSGRTGIAVGTLIAERPPHRTVHAAFPHTAPTLGV